LKKNGIFNNNCRLRSLNPWRYLLFN
jgi:hypothetical protein